MLGTLHGLAIVGLMAALNRARGDDRWKPSWMKGRALIWVALAVILVALLRHSPLEAVIIGIGYLTWGLLPWGRWYDLGRIYWDEGESPDLFERAVEAISFRSDHVAFFWRMLIGIAPLIATFAALKESPLLMVQAPVFAACAVALYEWAWRLRPKDPIVLAELLVGALWGSLILAL